MSQEKKLPIVLASFCQNRPRAQIFRPNGPVRANFGQNLAQNPLQPSGGQIAAPKIGGGGGFIVTSDPVIQEKEVPSTVYKEIKITFRNTPTVTTLTQTTLVKTQITSYVTRTVRNQPSLSPGSGFGGFNPLAALLG